MISSTEWQIQLVSLGSEWQFFATLTWDLRRMGNLWKRRHQVGNWLRQWAAREGTHEQRLPYVLRWEHGEIGGLPHCHALVGGFEARSVNLGRCFRQIHLWKPGIARVRLFEPGRAIGATAYMSKGKFSAQWTAGANHYELKKFGRVGEDSIYFSKRAREVMLQSVS
jgi:hypothetical protein